MIETELERLAAKRDQVDAERIAITEMLRTRAVEARRQGWSANRIANTIGVSKRTIQVWTDGYVS